MFDRRFLACIVAIFVTSCARTGDEGRAPEGSGGKADGSGLPSLGNGVARGGLDAFWGDALEFRLDLPPGVTALTLTTRGGHGDADLYLRRGLRVWGGGGGDEYDHRSATWGSDETIDVIDPESGSWYVLVHAASGFSDLSLLARYDAPAVQHESEPNDWFSEANVLAAPGSIAGTVPDEADFDTFEIVASGRLRVRLEIPPGSDLDLTLWNGDEAVIGEGFGVTGEPEEIERELGPTPAVYYVMVASYLDNVSTEPYVLSVDW